VIFIAGNRPMESEITPLLIMSKLEEFNYGRGRGHCSGHARGVVRHSVVHQFAAMVEPAICDVGIVGCVKRTA